MKKEQYFRQMDMMKESFKESEAKSFMYPYYIGRIEGMTYMAIEDDEIVHDYLDIVHYADEVKKEMRGVYYENESI